MAGFFCYYIGSSLENWSYYGIRSTITGETAMSKITNHPADDFILPSLLILFCALGAGVGFCLSPRPMRRIHKND
jgi:hypothetical protein